MNFDVFWHWLTTNWQPITAVVGTAATAVAAWTAVRGLKKDNQVDEAQIGRIVSALTRDHATQLGERDETIKSLRAAVEALTRQTDEPGLDAALSALETGDTAQAEALFERILKRREADGDTAHKEAGAAARHIGALAFLHDTDKALRAYRKAVALDPDDPDGWNRLGHLLLRTGDLTGAETACKNVLALGNHADDKTAIALAYGNLGIVTQKRGDLDDAEAFYRKALALDEELGSKEGMANQYGNLGIVARTRGDLDDAETFLRKALALHEELGRKEGMAADYGNLGNVAQTRGDLDDAETFLRKALALHEELAHKEGMANQYGNLGIVARTRGNLDDAEAFYRKALALNEELGRKEGIAIQYANLGIVAQVRGDIAEACRLWSRARELFAEVGMKMGLKKVENWMSDAGCNGEAPLAPDNGI